MSALAQALRDLIASIEFTPLGVGPLTHLANARASLAAHDAAVSAGECHVDDGMIACPLPAYTGEWVAIADGPRPHDDEGIIAWAHPAQAERIVACVNACQGIADPARLVPALNTCVAMLDDMADGASLDDASERHGAMAAACEALGTVQVSP